MTKRVSKKMKSVKAKLGTFQVHALKDAISFLQQNKIAKFDETVELVLKVGGEAAKSGIRGVVQLPSGTGKKVRVAVFAEGKNADEAKKAGAEIIGLEDLIEEIKKGKVDFDACIATPDVMSKVSAVAKVLGPRGMMPNPKLGTVGTNVSEMIAKVKGGQLEFRADKVGITNSGVGKISFKAENLISNIKAVFDAVSRSGSSKGPESIKAAFLSSTMGPGLRLDVSELSKM